MTDENSRGTLLIVDDQPGPRISLEALLIPEGYRILLASSGEEGLNVAMRERPDLMLLDVMMPGMDGYETCRRIRAEPSLAELPVVMITALDDSASRLKGIEAGADDFLSKPVNKTELRARVRTITRLNRYRRLVTQAAQIDYLTSHDELTGLPKRAKLEEELTALANRPGASAALVIIETDNIRGVTESYGPSASDQAIAEVAQRLTAGLTANAIIARIREEAFALTLTDPGGTEVLGGIARRLLDAVSRPMHVDGHDIVIMASAGISVCPTDGRTAPDLLAAAEAALRVARASGPGGGYAFAAAEQNSHAQRRLELLSALHRALDQDELYLVYQPQIRLSDGRLIGVEALMRWNDPGTGPISPGLFIPLAEETGLIGRLGERALMLACRQIRAWLDQGGAVPRVAVNLSIIELRRQDLVARMREILAQHRVPTQHLELEITETAAMTSDDQGEVQTLTMLEALKGLGITLAIDDFGTGYSSLAYLRRLPIDKLKIDRAFVKDLPEAVDDLTIVRTISDLARNLGLAVTAEGVETDAQEALLKQAGCHYGQGFLYSPGLPADELTRWLEETGRVVEPPTCVER